MPGAEPRKSELQPVPAPLPVPAPMSVGVGLKPAHYGDVLEQDLGRLDWFEVHPQNYMAAGGPSLHWLERIRADYPLSMHSVGLSLGSVQPVDPEQLQKFRALIDRFDPFMVSDHLSWSARGDIYFNDLLPLPYTDEALTVMCRNVERTQDVLGRRILIENPSTYLEFVHPEHDEAAFLTELAGRTGCGILLDINNLYVCARNHGYDAWEQLTRMPHDRVGEIHLAGHSRVEHEGVHVRIDDHGSIVCDDVWSLYRRYVSTYGPSPTLIEWDTDVPPFAALCGEASKARKILDMVPGAEGSLHAG